MRGTHRLIGVASTPVMFAIAISGAWWELRAVTYKPLANPCGAVLQNFKTEQNSTVAASNGAVSMKAAQNLATLDEALARIAVKFKEFRSTYIAFPLCPGGAFTVYGFEAGQNPLQSPYASRITISDAGERCGFFGQTSRRLSSRPCGLIRRNNEAYMVFSGACAPIFKHLRILHNPKK